MFVIGAEACIASGMSTLALARADVFHGLIGGAVWSQLLARGYPLRITTFTPYALPHRLIEVTRIKQRSLPDADFVVPADYSNT